MTYQQPTWPEGSYAKHIEAWVDEYRLYELRSLVDELLRGLPVIAQRSLLNGVLNSNGWEVRRRAHRWDGDRLLWRVNA